MKLLYFDTETTGLDPVVNSIIQISGIIEINGILVEEFNFMVKPVEPREMMSDQALQTHGYEGYYFTKFPEPAEVKRNLEKIFSRYVDKFNKHDKFIPVGQNISFDINFLKNFWEREGDKYLFSYVNVASQVDTLATFRMLRHLGLIESPDLKLETLCRYYDIELNAHDAISDINATRELYQIIKTKLKWSEQ
ncbi:MAG: 3'-5' exonuclease [Spirochaetes bacterium]|jgi:DNA polymerase-3 subunit epsilon|nr:3'-5' exonuclease [Spirochaetota bacterium]